MLAGEGGDSGRNGFVLFRGFDFDGEVCVFPPVELGDVFEAAFAEPGLEAEADEELDVWVRLLDLDDGGV